MKWFFIGLVVFLALLIGLITASDKVVAKVWELANEKEAYPSEAFEDERYDEPEAFAQAHQEFLKNRVKMVKFSTFMGDMKAALVMVDTILEMYEESDLYDADAYKNAQYQKVFLLEKTNRVEEAISYARELMDDFPNHPYHEQILSSFQRLSVRMINR